MTMQPKISIIIPVYNAEKYLAKCLDSVVNQTLRDIQIICVNDGSTDGSLTILREYETRDSRITVIDQPNRGQAEARNAGIALVRGKYIYFCDSDDWIDLTLCEKTYYRLESTSADVVLFFHDEIADAGHEYWYASTTPFFRWSVALMPARDYIWFWGTPWNRVIRTSFFKSLGVQFPVDTHEDECMHWALIANDPHINIIPEKLYHYRIHQTSLMGQNAKYLIGHSPTFAFIKGYLRSIGKYEQYRALLLGSKFSSFYDRYNNIQKDYRSELLRRFQESLDEEEMLFLMNESDIGQSRRDVILSLLGDNRHPCSHHHTRSWKSVWQTFNSRYLRKIIRPIKKIVKKLRAKKSHVNVGDCVRNCDCIRDCELRIRELSEQLAQRDREIVRLRECQDSSERPIAETPTKAA